MSYIGIDMGTSGCKIALVDHSGRLQQVRRCSYNMITPRSGWVELDPVVVWESIRKGLQAIAPFCGAAEAVAVSSIGEAMVLLDAEDTPLCNGILYLDDRCTAEFEQVQKDFGNRIYDITGTPPNQMFSLYRILWIKKNLPDVYAKTKKIFLFGDYISYMLCKVRGIDPSTASRTAMYDVERQSWSAEIMEHYGIDPALFSPVRHTGTLLGRIDPDVAVDLGLPETLKVYTGCHDQCSATLGGGALNHGDMVSGQGSTESYNLMLQATVETMRQTTLPYEPFVVPGYYFVVAGQLSYGTCIRWFAEKMEKQLYEQCMENGDNIYAYLNQNCAPSSQGVVFLPYLSGVRFDGGKCGAAGFMGMRADTEKNVLFRALLEGISFESRAVLSQFDSLNVPVNTIRMVGGVTASDVLMQIKADILQRQISILQERENGILGLAMICAVAEGRFADYAEASAEFLQVQKCFDPQRSYDEEYQRWLRFAELSRDLS